MKRTEAELCAAFVDVLEDGWTVYPETANWDLLLVCNKPFHDRHFQRTIEVGTQVGIEAKLRASVTVLRQALPTTYRIGPRTVHPSAGPHHRAILVPKASADFIAVAEALKLLVIIERAAWHGDACSLETFDLSGHLLWCDQWKHETRCELPEVIPDVVAGVPSPRTVSLWKIKAVKLCTRLRDHGYVTREDFRELEIHPSRWYNSWLVPGTGSGQWVKAPGWTPWDEVHPGVVEQLEQLEKPRRTA